MITSPMIAFPMITIPDVVHHAAQAARPEMMAA
jgi:hypothetical protein